MRVGIELEWLAPRGLSRRDFASRVAELWGCPGQIQPFFKRQSELSAVKGRPAFDNLTLGFRVRHPGDSARWVECVDDLTLASDLSFQATPREGWYRIVSDDHRILDLIERQADARAGAADVLSPVAHLFGAPLVCTPEGPVVLNAPSGQTIAICAPLPGERERPCEVVTSPLSGHLSEHVIPLFDVARGLGFGSAAESATHLHFDGTAFASTRAFRNLVVFFASYSPVIKAVYPPNPRCRRLGPWPVEFLRVVFDAEFLAQPWSEVMGILKGTGVNKYCDFNLLNLLLDRPEKHTFEVRTLPATLDENELLQWVADFVAILDRCADLELPLIEPLNPVKTPPEAFRGAFLALIGQAEGRAAFSRGQFTGLPLPAWQRCVVAGIK